jgi:alternate signal-mediated exported protein
MKKSTKGALAAGAAGVLLLGGAGSLASWTDAAEFGGGSIASGHLKLLPAGTATGCAGWTFADETAFAEDDDEIVPGDTLKQTCTYTADMVGEKLKATLSVEKPAPTSSTLADALDVSTVFEVEGEAVTEGKDAVLSPDDEVTAVVTVGFPVGANNDTNVEDGLKAVLNDFTITATQSVVPGTESPTGP